MFHNILTGTGTGAAGGMSSILFLVIIFVVFYFFLIRIRGVYGFFRFFFCIALCSYG